MPNSGIDIAYNKTYPETIVNRYKVIKPHKKSKIYLLLYYIILYYIVVQLRMCNQLGERFTGPQI